MAPEAGAPGQTSTLPAGQADAEADRGRAASARAPWQARFTINGRFYSQLTTGVQRYAREITLAIDHLLARANGTGVVMTPGTVQPVDTLRAIRVSPAPPLRGHAWEQVVLPARCDGPLLSLCNTGPVLHTRQVVCMHDANTFVQPTSYSSAFRLAYRALLPSLVRRAVRVTSVSKASAMQLASFLPIAARDIAILPNGHEHVHRWNAAASRFAANEPDRRPYVLLLGSRARHKNANLILQQAEALDRLGLNLVVAGGGAGIFSRADPVARRNIIELGVVADNDLAFLYTHALCLAFPSLTEGFGLPLVEAMALGCPVVSSDRASMPEVCGSAALFADPCDAPAWLAQFEALARSADLRADLRGRGLEQVRSFSWTASARGYIELFGDTV